MRFVQLNAPSDQLASSPQLKPGSRSLQCALSRCYPVLGLATLLGSLVGQGLSVLPVQAQLSYCQQSASAIAQKDTLRQAATNGSREAQKRYRSLIAQHGERLRKCRSQAWPQNEAIWIRLYPCDARPGAIDGVLDRIVNRGYNQVYIEVFGNGKVLLPANNNPTPWTPVLAGSRLENTDLLALSIRKGHERGLKVSAWLFTLNFGASYFRNPDRADALARNGLGQTSLTAQESLVDPSAKADIAFIDPYSAQARQDYAQLVRAIAQRNPDGMLFDYVRYPRGTGPASLATRVQDLWIYGESSRQALLKRAINYKGLDLIQRYLTQGFITAGDLGSLNLLYPGEREPLWQGRNPAVSTSSYPLARRTAVLQSSLWQLSVAHAFQGVLDFLNSAVQPVQQLGIPVGVVFFPDGNMTVGQGYDSRLQFWENFPKSIEWHPMSYGVCGNPSCIVSQLQRVVRSAPRGVQVKPVLAGIWQQPVSNRPPLEVQMKAIYRAAPQLKSVSHFAYSWQEPGSDRDRKYCQP